nr:glycoside hydrolase family 130 protein [Sphingomonas bacterium]
MTDIVPPPETALVRHLDTRLSPDPSRTVLRPFSPSDAEAFADPDRPRARRVVERLLALGDDLLAREVDRLLVPLRERHRDLDHLLLDRFEEVARDLPIAHDANDGQRLLIGAYFSQEYAFESAALFNPSIVRHPDQGGVADGDLRFVLGLRGIGEGHTSSLTFRTGVWRADGSVAIDPPGRLAIGPRLRQETLPNGRMLAHLDYTGSRDISETVIYPFLPSQGRGVEDVRLVEFTDGEGRATYRGTFTAFSGSDVRQGLAQTSDFQTFELRGVEGDLYAGKGMALFPRMIGGRYAMLSRQDNESVWLVFSDDLYQWSGGEKLLSPEQPWEAVQMGNCGSPIEIEEGFLVLTHGVGGVRNYCLGAALLDRDDPSRVIGRLAEPLLEPTEERDGYVPNVVYTCGALARGRTLLLPFAVADSFTRFAEVSLDALIARMTPRGTKVGAGDRRA